MNELNSLWQNSVYSDGSKFFVDNPLPKSGDKVTVSIQMAENSPVKHVLLNGKRNGVGFPIKMEKKSTNNGLDRYSAQVQIFEKEFKYHFILATDDKVYYYDQEGIKTHIPDEARFFRIITDYVQPQWVKSAVFYQIFPERFANGDPSLSVKDNEYEFDGHPTIQVKDWNQVPADYNNSFCLDFYGGDLIGIKKKIPYLKKLGVNALYLNPIFYAATVHKYDCLDYFKVDPHFGGDDALADLCQELHKNGMKIILDVSINHTGIANRWFNRDGTFFPKSEGAYNNKNSDERDYYFFNEDNSYKSWFDVETLPTLNYTSEKLRKTLYGGKESLVQKWLLPPFSTDGWRFDVADTMARNDKIQLHHEVWPQIRKSIHEANDQAYILAEDWTDCTDFLNGDEWDSPMNYYGSCRPIRGFYGQVDFFNRHDPELRKIKFKWSAQDTARCIKEYNARLPWTIRQVLFNLFDSHDIGRFHNDPEISKDAVRGAVMMIFTLPGCTNVYYGDEAEIDGITETNEGCRYPMPWDKDIENTSSYKLYSKMCQLKTKQEAFIDGGFKFVYADQGVLAFARFTASDVYITLCSNNEQSCNVQFDISCFGASFAMGKAPEMDVTGENLDAEIEKGTLKIKVPAGKAYLIKL